MTTTWMKSEHQLHTHASLGNAKEVDDEGFLMDVDIQTIDEDPPSREDKRRDVDHFFQVPR